jgi:hypothetical protein
MWALGRSCPLGHDTTGSCLIIGSAPHRVRSHRHRIVVETLCSQFLLDRDPGVATPTPVLSPQPCARAIIKQPTDPSACQRPSRRLQIDAPPGEIRLGLRR